MSTWNTYDTPMGPFTAVVADGAVLASGWTADLDALVPLIHPTLRPADLRRGELGAVGDAIVAYHGGELSAVDDVPVRQRSGEFLEHAWDVLRTVPAGAPLTYTEYAAKGHGEGFMHDTAMLLGVLGWSAYDGRAEVVTPYFGASGTGQINAVFPITPQDGDAVPRPVASRADGYTSVATRL